MEREIEFVSARVEVVLLVTTLSLRSDGRRGDSEEATVLVDDRRERSTHGPGRGEERRKRGAGGGGQPGA